MSIEQWTELVDQFERSDDSMEQFCQQQDLAMSTFQRWRSTINRSKDLSKREVTSGFTRVQTSPAIPASTPSTVTLQIGTSITVTISTAESV